MKALSFGEILWDVIGDTEHLGGAPFNLAAHLKKLGNDSWIYSAIGDDARGNLILEAAKNLGVNHEYLQKNDKPTGYVEVEIDNEGKPTYQIHENVAWDNIKSLEIEQEFDCFYFGTLAQRDARSRKTCYDVLEKIKSNEVFYDVNLRQNYYSREIVEKSLGYATLVKLNDEEVVELSKLLFENEQTEQEFCKKLLAIFELEIIVVTRGSEGCAVYSEEGTIESPGVSVKVDDTVGAGDAFSAGFLHKYFETNDLKQSAEFANKLGAYVASQAGAIPEYNDFKM